METPKHYHYYYLIFIGIIALTSAYYAGKLAYYIVLSFASEDNTAFLIISVLFSTIFAFFGVLQFFQWGPVRRVVENTLNIIIPLSALYGLYLAGRMGGWW